MTMTFGSSLIVMLVGMCIVFTGLIILIGAVKLLSLLLAAVAAKKAAPKQEAAPVAPAPVAQTAPAPVVEAGLDPQIVAVIAAAIAACEGSGKRLVVRSVKRVSGAWAAASRSANMNY